MADKLRIIDVHELGLEEGHEGLTDFDVLLADLRKIAHGNRPWPLYYSELLNSYYVNCFKALREMKQDPNRDANEVNSKIDEVVGLFARVAVRVSGHYEPEELRQIGIMRKSLLNLKGMTQMREPDSLLDQLRKRSLKFFEWFRNNIEHI